MINIGDKQLADLLSNIFWYFRHIFYFTMQLSRLSSQWMLAHFNKYQPWCTETFSFHQVTMNLSQFVSAIFLAPLQFWCPDISWLAASTDPLMDKRKTIMASGLFSPTTAFTNYKKYCFQFPGLELHHPVLRSSRYSTVSTVGDQDWLRLTDNFPRFQRFFSPFLPPAQSRVWPECPVSVEKISGYQAGHHLR